MRDIVKAFRRPQGRPLPVRLPDRNGGFPRLSDGVAHGFRCPASPRHARARRKPWEAVSMGHYQRDLVLGLLLAKSRTQWLHQNDACAAFEAKLHGATLDIIQLYRR